MEETDVSPGRGASFRRDWTKGNVFHNLLRLSWPMVVSSTLMMLGPTIDMIWVGRLGPASIAGVGVAGIAVQLMIAGMMGLTQGMRAMVARFVGAGDVRGANHVARQGFAISAAFAILMAGIGIYFTEPILGLFGLEADVVTEGTAYLRIMFVGMAAMTFRMTAESIMQASGDTINPMIIAIFYRTIHIALCPFLIFGWWLFPQMGVSGAAMTNIVSQSLGLVFALWILFKGRSRLRLTLENFRLDFNIIWRIIRIGFPALVSGAQRTFGLFFVVLFMAPFGTVAVAAHTLCQRVEMFLFIMGMAFGMASGTLVGQNLGARQPERAEKGAWLAVGLVEGITLITSVVILLWPESIIHIFSSDPALVAETSTYLRIAAAGFAVLGFMTVLMNSLSGAGDTVPAMVIGTLTTWAVTIPLAYFLPQITDLGALGVRWGMSAGLVFAAVTYTAYFRLGRWKRKKV